MQKVSKQLATNSDPFFLQFWASWVELSLHAKFQVRKQDKKNFSGWPKLKINGNLSPAWISLGWAELGNKTWVFSVKLHQDFAWKIFSEKKFRGIYSSIIPGEDKTCTLGQNGEEKWYTANFPYFGQKLFIFFSFFEKLQLKYAIKCNYQGGLGWEVNFLRFPLSCELEKLWGRKLVRFKKQLPLKQALLMLGQLR